MHLAGQPRDDLLDPSNLLRLAIYPALIGAVAVFLRHPRGAFGSVAIGLDAAIFSLALGAAAYELLFNWFEPIGSVPAERSSLLALPLLDLLALVLLTLIAGPA